MLLQKVINDLRNFSLKNMRFNWYSLDKDTCQREKINCGAILGKVSWLPYLERTSTRILLISSSLKGLSRKASTVCSRNFLAVLHS